MYGDIRDISEDVKAAAKLPPSYRLFPKRNIDDLRVNVEPTSVTHRWGIRDRYINGDETRDQVRKRKDNSNTKDNT